MLTETYIATIQSALDALAARPSSRIVNPTNPPAEFDTLGIKCHYCQGQIRSVVNHRGFVTKVTPANFYASCDIDGLDVSATGKTRAAALRALFIAIRNAASLNAPTLRVPLALTSPTKAKAQAHAKARAEREAKWHADLDRAVRAVETERAALDANNIARAAFGLRPE